MDIRKQLDMGSLLVMLVTLALFVAALFVKGLGRDLLLEAGVFLVSVKLIIMSYRNAVASQGLHEELRNILSMLQSRESRRVPNQALQPTGPTGSDLSDPTPAVQPGG